MNKKRSAAGGANWMDTYGDMVTLLLCFFVLLYSMCSIDEEKWRNIVLSFNPEANETIRETSGNEGPIADEIEQEGPLIVPAAPEVGDQEQIDEIMEELFLAFQNYAAQEGQAENISVSRDGGQIYVTFNGTTFFKANSYALTEEALPVLDTVGEMLSEAAPAIDVVRISGHTAQYSAETPNDVETDRFLAGNRATRVLVYLQTHTNNQVLDPAKLVSESWGQWHPVGPNDTADGKQMNRRVEMVISGRDLEEELGSDGVQSYYTAD